MSGPHLALIIFKVPKMTLIHSQSWKALFNFTETRTEKLVLDWLYWKQLTKPDKIHGATASSPEEHPLDTQRSGKMYLTIKRYKQFVEIDSTITQVLEIVSKNLKKKIKTKVFFFLRAVLEKNWSESIENSNYTPSTHIFPITCVLYLL